VKRLFLVLLLGLLPLQSVWAAAARYCAHEADPAQHFGHHGHEHAGAQQASPDTQPAEDDADCSVCHLACCASVPVNAAVESPSPVPMVLNAPGFNAFRSQIPSVPDRPDIAGV